MSKKTCVIGNIIMDEKVNCAYDIDGTEIITNEVFKNEIWERYADREFFTASENPVDDLIMKWNHFIVMNDYTFRKMWEVLTAQYDPTSNYDKITTVTTEFTGSEKESNKRNGEIAHTDVYGSNVSEHSIAPYDTQDYFNNNRVSTQEHTDTHSEKFNNLETINTKEFTDRKNISTETTTGNIGVRSMAEDLEKEISFRTNNIIATQIIFKFIDTYTFYR